MFLQFLVNLPGPGPQPNEPYFFIKFCFDTRPKSASLELLINFLAYLEAELWLKNPVFDKNRKVSQKLEFAISGPTLASHNSEAD